MAIAVYALDIGVYNLGVGCQVLRSTTAAWCRLDTLPADLAELAHQFNHPDETSLRCGRDIRELVRLMACDLRRGTPVALGFEAPMWFPVYRAHRARFSLFEPRFPDERAHEWYLQSGAAATLKAISLGCLLFSELTATMGPLNEVTLSTHPDSWGKRSTLTLFEAFVAGDFKLEFPGNAHEFGENEWDAATAAAAWLRVHSPLANDLPDRPLCEAGGNRDVVSVWSVIVGAGLPAAELQGPGACEVVGTRFGR